MGASPDGIKQKTYYVRENLAKLMAMIASRDDKRESVIVNEAFEHFISIKLTEEERRVFGYKPGAKNEDVSRDSSDRRERRDAGTTDGSRTTGGPPGRKKRAR